jgi:hypothetical protein
MKTWVQYLALVLGFLYCTASQANVPLFRDHKDPDFHTWLLQKSYRVASLFFPPESEAAIDNAVEAWNTASEQPGFMRHVESKDPTANIYIIPSYYITLLEPLGVAQFFGPHVCVIQISIQAAYDAEVYAHEMGHCLGFAHNREDTGSLMHPSILHGTPRVDDPTALELRKLLKELTYRHKRR